MRRVFRWTIRVGLGILAAIVVAGAGLYVWNPEGALIFALVVLQPLIANSQPPAIAEGQITAADWMHWDDGSRKLTAIFERRFPVKSSEVALKSTLLEQGFKPLPPPRPDCLPQGQRAPIGKVFTSCPTHDLSKVLQYRWGGLPCSQTITVDWTTGDRGEITHVSASYSGACL